jgi:hypothetical protein
MNWKMKESFKTDKIYDIGSTFFEDVKNAKLKKFASTTDIYPYMFILTRS